MKGNDIEEGFWVFVSHSTKDFEKVRLVRNALEESGFRPILFYLKCMEDEDEINELLKREIDARRRFILCDSPNAQSSKFVQSEVNYIKSQDRMYEVIDISKINMEKLTSNEDVTELIKPFLIRTKVFLSFSDDNRSLAYLVKSELAAKGFTIVDSDSVYYEAWKEIPGSVPNYGAQIKWLTKRFLEGYIESTLKDGYVLSLISKNSYKSNIQYFELEKAIEINPSQILPILIDDILAEQLPNCLQNKEVTDASHIITEEDKAKAIVEALIEFDLRNNK